MSKYTTELRYICENAAGLTESVGFDGVEATIKAARPKIFDFDYPFGIPELKIPFEEKFLSTYYTREICEETVGLWKLRLKNKLNKIMPYYNKLFEAEQLKYDPFNDVDITRVYNGTLTGEYNNTGSSTGKNTTSGTNKTTNKGKSVENALTAAQDTPQGGLTDLINNAYLSAASKSDSTTNVDNETNNQISNTVDSINSNNSNGKSNNQDQHTETIKGKQGNQSYAKLMMEYRKSLINVEAQLLDELDSLFFMLW